MVPRLKGKYGIITFLSRQEALLYGILSGLKVILMYVMFFYLDENWAE